MKNTRWKLIFLAVFVLMLTGCKKEEPFDAGNYVMGALNAIYKDDYSQHAQDVGISEKALKKKLGTEFREETKKLIKEGGYKASKDEVLQYTELEKEARRKVKYQVLDVKEHKNGTYTVRIKVVPVGVYDNLPDFYTRNIQQVIRSGGNEAKYMEVMIRSLKESIEASKEYDPQIVSFQVSCEEKDKKHIYSLKKEDLAEFEIIALHQ